jgi:hypothetical protein
MFLGTNAALRGCQEYFNRCAAAGSPIGATQTPSSYDNAASFNGTNQFLSNSSFAQSGSFTLSFWVNTSPPGLIGVINKGLATSNVSDWSLYKTGTSLCFAGSSAGQQSPAIATISLTQWNFVVVTYDATSLVKSIQVNNGTVSSNAGTTAFSNTYSQINLSCLNGSYFSGSMAGVGYWNRVLTASEVTQLWNNGAGRTYASLDSGLRTNLVSWWALNQNSVTADSHGTNTLTNTGSVTATNIGPVVTALSDPRQLIIDFAQGIDRLGLWNSMVCWPLRSSQNASTTQTAFSLGGGGTFNAALIRNPAWTSTGVIATGQQGGGPYVSSTYAMPASPVSYYAAIMPTPTSIGTNAIYYSTSGINVSGRQFVLQSSAVQNIDWMMGYNGNWPPSSRSFEITRGPSNYNVYASSKFASWRIQDSSTVFVSLNNSQTSGAITGWDSSSPAGVLNPVTTCPSPVAFSCIFNTFVSNSLDSQISALYKQTLGLGLGLP